MKSTNLARRIIDRLAGDTPPPPLYVVQIDGERRYQHGGQPVDGQPVKLLIDLDPAQWDQEGNRDD
jgi:hypothetical protein